MSAAGGSTASRGAGGGGGGGAGRVRFGPRLAVMTEEPLAGGIPTYLVVDGENIDATLGMSVLNRRPTPEERPRWEKVREFAETTWGQPVKALFFLNATSGYLPMSFVQALLAMQYRPVPLAGDPGQK